MTTPEERKRIESTLANLRREMRNIETLNSIHLIVRTSPEAAARLRTLSNELKSLSSRPNG